MPTILRRTTAESLCVLDTQLTGAVQRLMWAIYVVLGALLVMEVVSYMTFSRQLANQDESIDL